MPAYNFKAQFVEPIRFGDKTTTIRPPRSKRPTRVGDLLHLYTGMRTKQCRRIGVYRCEKIEPVTIYPDENYMTICGLACTSRAIADIAHTDGFVSVKAFFQFFKDTYGTKVLEMERITWQPACEED